MPSLITLIISIGIFFPINEKQIKSLNVFPRVGLERAQLAKIYKYLVKYWTALASLNRTRHNQDILRPDFPYWHI